MNVNNAVKKGEQLFVLPFFIECKTPIAATFWLFSVA